MTSIPEPGYGRHLTFASPLSPQRAERIVHRLTRNAPSTVLDIGCGWGELLLRILAAMPDATGVGVDVDQPDLARGRAAATDHGLADRVAFLEKPGAEHTAPADLVLCVGASHVYGTAAQALTALRPLVTPGGRLLFADLFWERRPTPEEVARMWPVEEDSEEEYLLATDLVDAGRAAGFVPLWWETVNRDEWEEFEAGHLADRAHWLLTYGDTPRAAEVRAELEERRPYAMARSTGELLGFGYLTLGVPE